MGSIRKQTIISSILVYFGFFIGAVNLFFYTKIGSNHGAFTLEQFGLTRIFFDFACGVCCATCGFCTCILSIYRWRRIWNSEVGVHVIGTFSVLNFSKETNGLEGNLEQNNKEPFGISLFNFLNNVS